MGIDIAALDSLKQRFEQDPDTKWYVRSYLGSVLAAEDEIIGYYAGPVPGEIQDVFDRQRLAIISADQDGGLLSFAQAQTLTAPQQLQGCTNLGIGDPAHNYVTAIESALSAGL